MSLSDRAASSAAASSTSSAPEAVLRWAILGCGDVCEVKSGPALRDVPGSALLCVMRRDASAAADFAARHGVPWSTGDVEEALAVPGVNAVYIAAPPGSHDELARHALRAGLPCLIEKPFCRDAGEARALVEEFERAGVPLWVAFYRRGLERFALVKRWLDAARIGPVTGVDYCFVARHREWEGGDLPWRYRREIAGPGGLFADLGSHLLDLLDWWLGPLEEFSGVSAWGKAPFEQVPASVALSFRAGGAPGVARWNFSGDRDADRLVIEGTRGRIEASCFGAGPVRLHELSADGSVLFHEETPLMPSAVHSGLIASLVGATRGQGSALVTGSDALRTMTVIDRSVHDQRREAQPFPTPKAGSNERGGI